MGEHMTHQEDYFGWKAYDNDRRQVLHITRANDLGGPDEYPIRTQIQEIRYRSLRHPHIDPEVAS